MRVSTVSQAALEKSMQHLVTPVLSHLSTSTREKEDAGVADLHWTMTRLESLPAKRSAYFTRFSARQTARRRSVKDDHVIYIEAIYNGDPLCLWQGSKDNGTGGRSMSPQVVPMLMNDPTTSTCSKHSFIKDTL
ncbi:hypothetical protein HZH68_000271 [Vespula germanica]|uniref:Uncharacterized protein n=1 Tax=Vespula germanica TaxID=30212 RepID=A0A834U5V1_VESGE|nr:hypothetical protein HZH68_000271 [Vespula germanica]